MEGIKVARAPLVACLTCPLCSSLLEDATTISECLHSFCRDCIHLKLTEDDTQSCPICDVYLGVAPLEKLRADPQLDELRNKLFGGTPRTKVPGDASPLPRLKRKERSLSSLGLPSAPSSSRRRRPTRQSYARAPRREITSSSEDEDVDDDDDEEEEKSDSSDSGDHRVKPSRDDKGKSVAAGYQSPLAYLAELADTDQATGEPSTRNNEPSSSGRALKREASGRFSKLSRPTKGVPRRRGSSAGNSSAKTPSSFQATPADRSGVWFALKPADNQSEDSVLPAIATPYVRITDGRLPVSLVKKYIATKLNLASDTDVELTCRGQPVVPNLPLESVQSIWLAKPRDETQHRNPSKPLVADNASTDFLMTLTYRRPGGTTC